MIKVIDVESKAKTPVTEGYVRTILGPSEEGTRVLVAIEDVNPGKTCRLVTSDRTQIAYILEGNAKISYTSQGTTVEQASGRRTGVYLEPGEQATITATSTPVKLLLVTVPKYTTKPTAGGTPSGYLFDEAQ